MQCCSPPPAQAGACSTILNIQFRESADKINEETVRASPAKYMSYVPEVEKSLEEKFEELKASNEMLTGCVLEMSELVYQ